MILERILQKIMKKRIILGTSDAWLMSHLSQRTGKPAYHIVDCRIYGYPQSSHNVYRLAFFKAKRYCHKIQMTKIFSFSNSRFFFTYVHIF